MKVTLSLNTAYIIKDHGNISVELKEQIDQLPPKAEVVFLDVEREELATAYLGIKEFFEANQDVHHPTYQRALEEIASFVGDAR